MHRKLPYHFMLFLALLLASTVAVILVLVRAAYSGRLRYAFLIWNLALAWLPYLFALGAYRWPKTAVLLGPLWLIFFPNAPYLITDLMHLHPNSAAPIWYDALMLFNFALTGLMLGFLSLYLMQTLVRDYLGRGVGWLFAVTALGLSGFGVYIGRFLRWNSWDIFVRPRTVLFDLGNNLVNPQLFLRTYAVSLLLAGMMAFAYVVMVTMSRLKSERVGE